MPIKFNPFTGAFDFVNQGDLTLATALATFVQKAGDQMTGNLVMSNNLAFQLKTTADAVISGLAITTGDEVNVGSAGYTTYINGGASAVIQLNGANANFLSTGVVVKNGGGVIFHSLDASGNGIHKGYLGIGSSLAPTNTTAGDLTFIRGFGSVMGLGVTSPVSQLHVKGLTATAVTGTLAVTNNSAVVTGTGTLFSSELMPGDAISIAGVIYKVLSVASGLSLNLTANYTGTTASGLTATRDADFFEFDTGFGTKQIYWTRGYIGSLGFPNYLFVNGSVKSSGDIVIGNNQNIYIDNESTVGKSDFAFKCGTDGTFIVDQPQGGSSLRFKTGGNTGSTYWDVADSSFNSLFKVFDHGQVISQTRTNSTTAIQFKESGGAVVLNIDTTNKRVVIGATAQTARLTVDAGTGSVSESGLYLRTSPASGFDALRVSTNWLDGSGGGIINVSNATGNKLYMDNNGKLGISTASPLVTLDVSGSTFIRGANTNTPATPIAAVEFFVGRSSTGSAPTGQTTGDIAFQFGGTSGGFRHWIKSSHDGGGATNGNALEFFLNTGTTAGASSTPGTSNTRVIGFYGTGRVGIGITNPQALLSLGSSLANTKLALYDPGSGAMYGLGIQSTQFRFHIDSSVSKFSFLNAPAGTEILKLTGTGSLVIGAAALATTATDGFLYIPSCAGVPTGVPTTQTGTVPMVFDSTNNNLYIYNAGWKKTTTFA